MSLLIGIDASRAVRPKPTGTEYYSREIIRALIKNDRQNHYRLYAPHLPKDNFGELDNVEWRILPTQRLWSQLQLARELKKNPPDVLFVPAHVVPLLSKLPSVVMIHGLEYKYSAPSYRKRDRIYLNFSTSTSIAKAKAVITPSTQTKKDVVKYYHCPAGKITIIPESYDKNRFDPAADHGQRPIDQPYLFFIGRIEERKNLSMLIDAFCLLRKEKGSRDIKLVLAGKPGYGFEKIKAKIEGLPTEIRESILLPGYLSGEDAPRYLKHAAAFCFPSLYEGFGIPLLEAFGIGTPVISSNSSSLPEVAGDAAVLLPPDQPLSWAAAMSRIIHQPGYADGLRHKGFAQASRFSWEKAAEGTLKVIEHAAGKN